MLFLSLEAFPHPALGRAPPPLDAPPLLLDAPPLPLDAPPLPLDAPPLLLDAPPLPLDAPPLPLDAPPLLLDAPPLLFDAPPDDEPPLDVPGCSFPPVPLDVSAIPGSQATSKSDEASARYRGVLVARRFFMAFPSSGREG